MFKDYPLIKESKKSITQFYPHVPKSAIKALKKVLSGRWIGQGPLVDKLEKVFSKRFANKMPSLAVGSGTDALHLAYILAGLKKGDEIICPIFTCTATNIPLLYFGAKIIKYVSQSISSTRIAAIIGLLLRSSLAMAIMIRPESTIIVVVTPIFKLLI